MTEHDTEVDVIVIGMGVAGESVAAPLAEAGLEVVGIEAGLVGGECPYWGCIPSKMMIRAANLLAEARRIEGVAGTVSVTPDWAPVARRIREQATDNWDDTVAVDRFVGQGGIFVRGKARFVGDRTVEVEDRRYRARIGVVIATGTTPAVPPIPGIDTVEYWTNHQVIEAESLPESIIVLGAGAIGAELSQVMARFGTRVTLVEAADRVLPLEEPEVGELIATAFSNDGIDVRTGVLATAVAATSEGVAVTLAGETIIQAERLLVATGRRTDLAGLGVDAVGIDPTLRFAPVDAHLRVSDGVWAVGDITGEGLFTHVAIYQGGIAAADLLAVARGNEATEGADYRTIPRVTFTDPEVGSVGRSARDAEAQGISVLTAIVEVPGTARGWLHGTGNEGLIKLVVDRDREVIVGATSAGPHGGEVLGLLTLAVHEETPIGRLRSMVYAYPSFHKGIEDALHRLDL